MPFDPRAVRVGPGIVYVAPLGSTEPTNLTTAWDAAWIQLGYTNEGSTWTFDNTFEDVNVAEEFYPVHVLQTASTLTIAFAAAETTATNLQRAFNGGTITPSGAPPNSIITFEPPPAGTFTEVMLGWQHGDNMERWVFRRCIQAGSVEIQRRKAPDKSTVPMSYRGLKPTSLQPWKAITKLNFDPTA